MTIRNWLSSKLKMTPCFHAFYRADRGLLYAIVYCDISLRTVIGANRNDLLVGKLHHWMRYSGKLPASVSSLFKHIKRVFFLRAKKKVRRIYTSWHIALVQDAFSVWNVAKC